MAVLLVWVTFPGGGVYPWVWIPAACATILLAARVRPTIAADTRVRPIDLFLIAVAVAIGVQLVPLPYGTLQTIDPQTVPVRVSLWLMPPDAVSAPPSRLPISIQPRATGAALAVFSAVVLLYWTCRRICESGGTGRIIRAIAFIAIVASTAAIVQRSQTKELLFGLWRPLDAGARPYGPFVNRNHFATWAIMSCPLIFGYLLARAPSAREHQQISQRVVAAAKQLGSIRIWLAASVAVTTLAVVISTSRSGLIGLMGALAASFGLSRGRQVPHTQRWTIFQGVLLVAVVLSFANFGALIDRVDQTIAQMESTQLQGRPAIWRDTYRLIGDFPWTGTGAGTYRAAIIHYKTAEPGYSIAQAHNEYLQIAAEGGALIAVPAVGALLSFLFLFWRRIAEDRSGDFLVRAGAGAGIAGVMLQSLWETGLRMPANAMLFAVLAAIATHAPGPAKTTGHRTY